MSLALLLAAVVAAACLARADAGLLATEREGWLAAAEAGDPRAARLAALLARRGPLHLALRLSEQLAVAVALALLWTMPSRLAWLVLLAAGALLARLAAAAGGEPAARAGEPWASAAWRLWGALLRPLAQRPAGQEEQLAQEAEESLLELVEAAPLAEGRRQRIEDILNFEDRTVGQVMVPRVDIVALAADADWAEAARCVVDSGRTRLPVHGGSTDQILGVLHARDLLAAWGRPPATAAEMARPPLFVAESARLDQVLRELRRQRSSVAVVVDEYGGTAGLVTIEDLVEEIVGEIRDESDAAAEPDLAPRPEGGWLVSAGCELADLAQRLEFELPEAIDCQTVGGLALVLAGDLPEPGEVVIWELGQRRLALLVLALAGRRLTRLAAAWLEPQEESQRELWNIPAPSPGTALMCRGATPLAALEAAAGYEEQRGGSNRVADLFVFWPPDQRLGRQVTWRRHQARAMGRRDGDLVVEWTAADD